MYYFRKLNIKTSMIVLVGWLSFSCFSPFCFAMDDENIEENSNKYVCKTTSSDLHKDAQEKKDEKRISKLYTFFKVIYEAAPINFSSLTGFSHLEIPRLWGGILGRCNHIKKNGLLENALQASKLASMHSSGACHFWIGYNNVLLITKPNHIKQVLLYNDSSISRNAGIGDNIAVVLGKSLFFNDGKLWRHKRSSWKQWLYMTKTLESYAPKMQILISNYLGVLNSSKNKFLDLQCFFTQFTLDVIGQTLMACDNLPEVAEELTTHIVRGLRTSTSPQTVIQYKLEKFRNFLPFSSKRTNLDTLASDIRQYFIKAVLEPNDKKFKTVRCLLQIIHETDSEEISEKSTDQKYSEESMADSIFLAFAGHTTTAATFQFAVKLLAAHPKVASKLRKELKSALKNNSFQLKDVEKVDYLDWVIQETLRLYPPVPIISRGVTKSFYLTDAPVGSHRKEYLTSLKEWKSSSIYAAKGTSVIISPYLLHRTEDNFKNANQFIPERFVKERKFLPYSYIPFGTGPRACLGQRFALQELKLMLASIYYHYDVEIENNNMSVDSFDVTLTPLVKPMGKFRPLKF